MTDPSKTSEVRADVWLWAARFFKTRSLAKQAIDGGKVELNGAACKPARPITVGDRLRVSRGEEKLECEVIALSVKRGPASEAQKLYSETEESAAGRERQREDRRMTGGALLRPASRPDKKARRLIQAVKDSL
ncbi:heat shock protein Hsp15 [Luteibacter rhizovicinus]|uniref:Heat shock protein 15 n=1 Tax=Luteibacter rhizovicinus TaxID=242606 RepID=A0A4R3YXD3_9GAMM|nr:S4 domain-containing protein [Luteibacter rhizovicinus]TCV97206.1 heat shock protein Hsp15 [Luteibacter rhizovicinus]